MCESFDLFPLLAVIGICARAGAEGVSSLSVSSSHILACLSSGDVCVWGSSDVCALGLGRAVKSVTSFTRVPGLKHATLACASITHGTVVIQCSTPQLRLSTRASSSERQPPPSLKSLCEKTLAAAITHEVSYLLYSIFLSHSALYPRRTCTFC